MDSSRVSDVASPDVRVELAKRLRARRLEIEDVIFAVVSSIADRPGHSDSEYITGLRATVTAIVDYSLNGIEQGPERSAPIPSVAVEQVQRAARSGVGLETVLLRYTVGHRHLARFVMGEAEKSPRRCLRDILDHLGIMLEMLMRSLSTEYHHEVKRTGQTIEQRRADRVRRLLAGELEEATEFGYAFDDMWHLGLIVLGAKVHDAIRCLEKTSTQRLLLVVRDKKAAWAWIATRERSILSDLDVVWSAVASTGVSLAIGEPSKDLNGWRLTHQQAQAALLLILQGSRAVVRYTDDMILTAALQNPTLAKSLEEIYLSPLASQRDGGVAWRKTLRAYLDARGNIVTAAAKLGVDRSTVRRRLENIERQLDRMLHTCQAEIDVALRLHDLRVSQGAVMRRAAK